MCCVLDVCPCSRRSTKCLYLCEKIIALWHNWLFKLTHPGCVTKHNEFCSVVAGIAVIQVVPGLQGKAEPPQPPAQV